MADIVIRISEEDYRAIKNGDVVGDLTIPYVFDAIRKGTPLADVFNKIKAEIKEEKEYAYADFEEYKIAYLGADPETVEDDLPQDDFRYGMERCLEIINKHTSDKND